MAWGSRMGSRLYGANGPIWQRKVRYVAGVSRLAPGQLVVVGVYALGHARKERLEDAARVEVGGGAHDPLEEQEGREGGLGRSR